MTILRYAGIGPRKTPDDQLEIMGSIAQQLAESGWHLSSGWGHGADQAFGTHAPANQQTQWIPWPGFNGASREAPFVHVRVTDDKENIAAPHHPYWGNMKLHTRRLMCRNVDILLGDQLDQQVDMVVYWQSEAHDQSFNSGTNHTRRMANTWGIPSFNIRHEADQKDLCKYVEYLEQYR
jgi:hypothetical protein